MKIKIITAVVAAALFSVVAGKAIADSQSCYIKCLESGHGELYCQRKCF